MPALRVQRRGEWAAHRQGLKSTDRIVCATNANPGLKAAAPQNHPGRRKRAAKAKEPAGCRRYECNGAANGQRIAKGLGAQTGLSVPQMRTPAGLKAAATKPTTMARESPRIFAGRSMLRPYGNCCESAARQRDPSADQKQSRRLQDDDPHRIVTSELGRGRGGGGGVRHGSRGLRRRRAGATARRWCWECRPARSRTNREPFRRGPRRDSACRCRRPDHRRSRECCGESEASSLR